MCGIAGVYHFNNSKTVDERTLVAMRDSLVHRGPDSAGLYVSPDKKTGLGFRRLAIIDLSEAGNQPMPNEDKNIWIVFNGEIYNFQELRKDLIKRGHTFRSNTDTEVVVHQYEEDGPGCLKKFNGMFAFAIYDERKSQIFFARDRLGIKPFYYGVQNGAFLFGSEIKAILADPSFKRELNEEALYYYTTFACCPAPHTLFGDIQKLPAGWCGIAHENGNIDLWQYWDCLPSANLKFKNENLKTVSGRYWTNAEAQEEYYIEEVRRLLEDSVRRQMVSDVPFGVFLSGGIDSSTNAIFMSEALGHPVETFSIGFQDFPQLNEFQYSRQVADMLGAKRHEIQIGKEEFHDFLPLLAYHADDPNGDPVCLPVSYISKLIRDSGIIMAQVGEGADELFAGYDHYRIVFDIWRKVWRRIDALPYPLRKMIALAGHGLDVRSSQYFDRYKELFYRIGHNEALFWGGAIAFLDYEKQFLFRKEFQEQMRKEGITSYKPVKSYYDTIDQEIPEADFLQRLIYLELKIRLPELLLMRVDKMASAYSIETRVPFLDHRIVELAMNIPQDLRMKNMVQKHILKKAVEGKVPDNIINRKKQGFGTPLMHWLYEKEETDFLKDKVMSSSLMQAEYFNEKYVNGLFEKHQQKKGEYSFQIWNIVTLALWYDTWLKK